MGDFDHYTKQGPSPGRTIPHEITELRNLDGTHPLVHIEYLGGTNASLMEEWIAAAGKNDGADRPGLAEAYEKTLDTLIRHGVRHIERVFFSDGTPATDADIPAFLRSIPYKAIERMFVVASDVKNYSQDPIATPADQLAEKS